MLNRNGRICLSSFISKEGFFMTQMHQGDPSKGLAIGSLVCGIISVVFFWIPWVDILTLILGIVAIVLAVVAGKKAPIGQKSGMAVAGLILGIIGVVLSTISFVTCVACYGCAACSYGCSACNAYSLYY